MDRISVALLQLLFLAIAITAGDAAKCYACNSGTDKKCGDPFIKSGDIQPSECIIDTLKNLGSKVSNVLGIDTATPPETTIACLKVAYTDASGNQYVMRSCDTPASGTYDPCKMYEGKAQLHCSICEGEGCNGAGRLGGVKTLFYLLLPCLVALKAIAA